MTTTATFNNHVLSQEGVCVLSYDFLGKVLAFHEQALQADREQGVKNLLRRDEEYFSERLQGKKGAILGAFSDGNLIGMAGIDDSVNDRGKPSIIQAIYMAERKPLLSKGLIDVWEQHAWEAGRSHREARCATGNIGGLKLLLRHGLEVDEVDASNPARLAYKMKGEIRPAHSFNSRAFVTSDVTIPIGDISAQKIRLEKGWKGIALSTDKSALILRPPMALDMAA